MYFLVRLTGGAANDWRTCELVIFEGTSCDSVYNEAGDYAESYLGYDFPEIEILETGIPIAKQHRQ